MQLSVLRTLQGKPRASILGCAGAGKSLLAIEKARRLAADGFDTVLACFNQPLARAFARTPALQPHIESGRLVVGTFHDLCRRLATEAGTLPPQPAHPDREWFDTGLPGALERALPTVGGRVQALVIDEGQDFDELWLMLLEQLLVDPKRGVLYVFHDPAQAIYRPDAVATLGLEEYPLPDNCRNARPIHDLAYRFYDGTLPAEAVREDGREPLIVEAEGPVATVDAVRAALHDLVHVEKVDRAQIAVLTGVSLEHSATWRQRRFKGDLVLWNGGVDDEGRSKGLSADQVPDQPPGTILCESIYRFKGLERDVVVLVEIRPEDERLRAADVRGRDAGQAPPGGDRAAGTCGVAAVMVFARAWLAAPARRRCGSAPARPASARPGAAWPRLRCGLPRPRCGTAYHRWCYLAPCPAGLPRRSRSEGPLSPRKSPVVINGRITRTCTGHSWASTPAEAGE